MNDGKGITTYTYGSGSEHRGLVTSLDVGSAPGTFTASYDADGSLASQTYPNGLVATTTSDNTGNPTALDYSKAGSTWLHFAQTADARGNTVVQSSPQSSQAFSYDNAGRLIQTRDTYSGACTTRRYTYDGGVAGDSNRTQLASYPAGAGGACSTTTSPSTTTSTFDQADRVTNTGYAYDSPGRSFLARCGSLEHRTGSSQKWCRNLIIGFDQINGCSICESGAGQIGTPDAGR